jgi:hypothetical protein
MYSKQVFLLMIVIIMMFYSFNFVQSDCSYCGDFGFCKNGNCICTDIDHSGPNCLTLPQFSSSHMPLPGPIHEATVVYNVNSVPTTIASILCPFTSNFHYPYASLRYVSIYERNNNSFTATVKSQSDIIWTAVSSIFEVDNSINYDIFHPFGEFQVVCLSGSCDLVFDIEMECSVPEDSLYSECYYGHQRCNLNTVGFYNPSNGVSLLNYPCCLDQTVPVVNETAGTCHCGLIPFGNGLDPQCNLFKTPSQGICDGKTGLCTCFGIWAGPNCYYQDFDRLLSSSSGSNVVISSAASLVNSILFTFTSLMCAAFMIQQLV